MPGKEEKRKRGKTPASAHWAKEWATSGCDCYFRLRNEQAAIIATASGPIGPVGFFFFRPGHCSYFIRASEQLTLSFYPANCVTRGHTHTHTHTHTVTGHKCKCLNWFNRLGQKVDEKRAKTCTIRRRRRRRKDEEKKRSDQPLIASWMHCVIKDGAKTKTGPEHKDIDCTLLEEEVQWCEWPVSEINSGTLIQWPMSRVHCDKCLREKGRDEKS